MIIGNSITLPKSGGDNEKLFFCLQLNLDSNKVSFLSGSEYEFRNFLLGLPPYYPTTAANIANKQSDIIVRVTKDTGYLFPAKALFDSMFEYETTPTSKVYAGLRLCGCSSDGAATAMKIYDIHLTYYFKGETTPYWSIVTNEKELT